jgi:hypothetical protein
VSLRGVQLSSDWNRSVIGIADDDLDLSSLQDAQLTIPGSTVDRNGRSVCEESTPERLDSGSRTRWPLGFRSQGTGCG